MTEPSFMYEAKGQVLVIHLPKELDHRIHLPDCLNQFVSLNNHVSSPPL